MRFGTLLKRNTYDGDTMKEFRYIIADKTFGLGDDLYSKEELTDDEFRDIVIKAYGELLGDTKPKFSDLRKHILDTDDRFYIGHNISQLGMQPTTKILVLDEHDIILFIIVKDEKSIVLGSGR